MPFDLKLNSSEYAHGLLDVFSSAVFCAFSWSLVVLFWEIPSFLLRLSVGDILGYAAYQFMFALLESIAVTIFIAILGLILPASFLKNNIRTTGIALVFAFAVNSIIFKEQLVFINWISDILVINPFTTSRIVLKIWTASLIILPISLVMLTKNKRVERVIKNFGDNLSILSGMYVILSLLGIFLVMLRNIN